MAKNKYYAVRKGYQTGIFHTWDECQKQTHGYPGAEFKSFPTIGEAEAYMECMTKKAGGDMVKTDTEHGKDLDLPEVYAFTDGSFNEKTNVYGYGGFLHYSDGEEDIQIRGNDCNTEYATSRNVSGEVLGALAAMHKAIEMGLPTLTLYYDYRGIELWTNGSWKASKPVARMYVSEYEEIKKHLAVKFQHVPAHTGIPGNELADKMAKEEVGIL